MEDVLTIPVLYLAAAVGGGAVMVLQLAMTLMGADADAHDIAGTGDDLSVGDEYVDTHSLSTWFFGVLSFRSIVAAIAFFGIGGRVALGFGAPALLSIPVAIGAGVCAMVLVAWLMMLLHGLHSEGNVNIRNCMGKAATVYLAVPGGNGGAGKVTVTVQERSMEYDAVTKGESLETGARVIVVGVPDGNTLEVERADHP